VPGDENVTGDRDAREDEDAWEDKDLGGKAKRWSITRRQSGENTKKYSNRKRL
jgi:hypothetical protein